MDRQNIAKQSIEVLENAERRLRELVGSSASSGDYTAIMLITNWARSLGDLVGDARAAWQTKSEPPSLSPPELLMPATSAANSANADRHRLNRSSRRLKRSPLKGEYPKFFRRGDELVKVGWSKKERQEYQHKAPRAVVDILATSIAARFGNGKMFMVEDLLPLKDPNGNEIPNYQTYLALALLRASSLVEQHGRQGYSIEKGSQTAAEVISLWERLPSALP
jgi:hypothetical protein